MPRETGSALFAQQIKRAQPVSERSEGQGFGDKVPNNKKKNRLVPPYEVDDGQRFTMWIERLLGLKG